MGAGQTDWHSSRQLLPPARSVWVRIFHVVSDLDTFFVIGIRNSAAPAKDMAESLVGRRGVSIGIGTKCTVGSFR